MVDGIEDLAAEFLGKALTTEPPNRSGEEYRARKLTIGRLMENWKGATEPGDRMSTHKRYIEETWPIPLDKLYLAVSSLIRTRKWPKLPLIGEIFTVAEVIAGMDKEQYVPPNGTHTGIYKLPEKWPAAGSKHSQVWGEESTLHEGLALRAGSLVLRLGKGDR